MPIWLANARSGPGSGGAGRAGWEGNGRVLLVILGYLLAALAACTGAAMCIATGWLVVSPEPVQLAVLCALIGGAGGCVYCIRGVYLHKCVHRDWSPDWYVWYFIRPVVSLVCGAVSYVFLAAGLLVLESKQAAGASHFGFYALAFVAGLNVDRFIAKIEDVAKSAWGIEISRAARDGSAGGQSGSEP